MRTLLTLFHKECLLFLRDRTAVALTFLVPIVMIYIFGQVFGVGRTGGSGPTGIPLAVVSQTDAPVAATITDALRREKTFKVIATWPDDAGVEVPLTEERARALFRENRIRFALVFPPDTQGDDRFGLKLRFLHNPRNDVESQTVNGILQKTLFTAAPSALFQSLRLRAVAAVGPETADRFYRHLADNVARTFGGDADRIYADLAEGKMGIESAFGPESGSGDFLEQLVKIESEQMSGQAVKNPQATRSVGGWAMMFLLFAVSGGATSLFEEKKAGLFRRLLSSPVRRTHILWSKHLWGVALGFVQLLVMFVAGRILFDIDIAANLGNLLLICLVASTACTAFGMLVASISSSPAAASGLATFLILTMSAIGGAWFPTSFMPEFIQQLSRFTLVYWSMEGFVLVLWANCTLVELLPTVGVLLGLSALVGAFSAWRFRRGQLFD